MGGIRVCVCVCVCVLKCACMWCGGGRGGGRGGGGDRGGGRLMGEFGNFEGVCMGKGVGMGMGKGMGEVWVLTSIANGDLVLLAMAGSGGCLWLWVNLRYPGRTQPATEEGRGKGAVWEGSPGYLHARAYFLVSLTLQSSIGTTPILPYLAVQGTTIRNMQSEYMGTIHYNTHGHRGKATPGLQLAMGLKEDACMQRSV